MGPRSPIDPTGQDDGLVPACQQSLGQVTADEARAASDRYTHGRVWTLIVRWRWVGLGAICINPSTWRSLPSLAAHNDLLGAHGRQEGSDRYGEPLLDQRVVDAVGLATFSDEPRPFEHAQVS